MRYAQTGLKLQPRRKKINLTAKPALKAADEKENELNFIHACCWEDFALIGGVSNTQSKDSVSDNLSLQERAFSANTLYCSGVIFNRSSTEEYGRLCSSSAESRLPFE